MLRTVTALCFAMLIVSSCSVSKEGRRFKQSLNGNWVLQTIVAEGITGKIKAQVLGEADFNCFIGSNWKFNVYTNLGSYSINRNGNECAALTRNIRWSVYEESGKPPMLQYKRVDDRYKDMDANDAGYRFTIVSSDSKQMKLRNEFQFEGKTAAFIYNFIRN